MEPEEYRRRGVRATEPTSSDCRRLYGYSLNFQFFPLYCYVVFVFSLLSLPTPFWFLLERVPTQNLRMPVACLSKSTSGLHRDPSEVPTTDCPEGRGSRRKNGRETVVTRLMNLRRRLVRKSQERSGERTKGVRTKQEDGGQNLVRLNNWRTPPNVLRKTKNEGTLSCDYDL